MTLKERLNLIGQSQLQELIPQFDWLEKAVTSDIRFLLSPYAVNISLYIIKLYFVCHISHL